MTTYKKETALYNTGAIAGDIEQAGKTAGNFISSDASGIMVYDGESGVQAPSTVLSGTKNVLIDEDSVSIRNGTTSLAEFGSTVRIGELLSKYLMLSSTGVSMRQDSTNGSSKILDYSQYSSAISITETYTIISPYVRNIHVKNIVSEIESVEVNGVDRTSEFKYRDDYVSFVESRVYFNDGDVVVITYKYVVAVLTGAPLSIATNILMDVGDEIIYNTAYVTDTSNCPSLTSVKTLSPEYSRTSGSSNVTVSAKRWGQMVQVNMRFPLATASAGADMAVGSLDDIPNPVGIIRAVAYNGSTIGILNMSPLTASDPHIRINVRVNQAVSANASSYFYFGFTYLTTDQTLDGQGDLALF